MADALILSGGTGAYTDPWHPFADTSERVAALLSEAGHRVEVSFDVADRLRDLTGVDLLVAGAPSPEPPPSAAVRTAASAALNAFLSRGGAVLAIHVGVTTLVGIPSWSALIGARWVPGTSMHPPFGRASVLVRDDPRTGSARTFVVEDELYTHIAWTAPVDVVVEHRHDGLAHPLIWTREANGGRVVADALGHGPESFDAPEHREIVTKLVAWATERRGSNEERLETFRSNT